MKKLIVFLLLYTSSMCFAAYSSADVELQIGGTGETTSALVIAAPALDITAGNTALVVDIDDPIRMNDLDTVPITRFRVKGGLWSACASITLRIYSRVGDDLTLEASSETITTGFPGGANTIFDYTLLTPINVRQGWLVGIEYSVSGTFGIRGTSQAEVKSHLYRWDSPAAGNKTLSGADANQDSSTSLQFSVFAEDEIYLSQELDISSDVLTTKKYYRINRFGNGVSQWIVIEGITVPTNETLSITLWDTRALLSSWAENWWFEIDMASGSAFVRRLDSAGGATDWQYSLPDETIAGGDIYDLYVNYSSAASGSVDMYTYLMNRSTGVGFGGLAGIGTAENQQDNVIVQVDDGADARVNTREWGFMSLESTNVATPATAVKIAHCRKPIVIVGDSHATRTDVSAFPAGYTAEPPTALYVPGYMAFAFGNQRYVIYGGTGGSAITFDGTNTRNIFTKQQLSPWGPDRLASAGVAAIMLSDAVVVFVDGPGVNDINTLITDDTTRQYTVNRIVGYLSKMYSDAIYNQSDVVVCSLLPWPDGQGSTALMRQAITEINDGLRNAAWRMNIPYADLTNYSLGYAATSHPTAVGSKWIAEQIAFAQINNSVVSSESGGDTRSRYDFQKVLPVSD